MKNIIFAGLLLGAAYGMTPPVEAHPRHHHTRATHSHYRPAHTHCHTHPKKGLFHCHRHFHTPDGRGHHSRKNIFFHRFFFHVH